MTIFTHIGSTVAWSAAPATMAKSQRMREVMSNFWLWAIPQLNWWLLLYNQFPSIKLKKSFDSYFLIPGSISNPGQLIIAFYQAFHQLSFNKTREIKKTENKWLKEKRFLNICEWILDTTGLSMCFLQRSASDLGLLYSDQWHIWNLTHINW